MFETLGIQWVKLIAQTINFSIVLFVLWKFAYKPVFAMLEARRTPGDASAALGDALGSLLEALIAAAPTDRVPRDLLSLLLGRDRDGSLLGAARWLSEDPRARVLETALTHRALDALGIALDDLERQGVPAAVIPLLREIAASDPDPITRQHARQLARGERL